MQSPQRIILIGYRGSGKTSVAAPLAERLAAPWFDADHELQQAAGKTIAQIFAQDGEAAFRDWEEQTIAQLLEREPPLVLALGGGAVMRQATRDRVAAAGWVVWLKASPAALHARISNDQATAEQRPQLTAYSGLQEIEQLLGEREGVYQAASHAVVETENRSPAEIADLILQQLPRE